MKIAFYAPLKSPHHPTPSGDRRVARLLMQALAKGGFEVALASELRLRAKPETQRALHDKALEEAGRLLQSYGARPETKPDLWFTYHHYYKCVDWLGYEISRRMGIPYILAEASHAPKRNQGDWHFNHQGAEKITRQAQRIFCLNKADKECLGRIVPGRRLIDLKPFIDISAFAPSLASRTEERRALAASYPLDPKRPWIISVAMMRSGDKLKSYQVLGQAMRKESVLAWRPLLIVIGDGEAKAEVQAALSGVDVLYAGQVALETLPRFLRAGDIMAWPAINEAFCMALLEAHACGLPVVAGDFGGVSAIVADKETGLLAKPGDSDDFATRLSDLLQNEPKRQNMGEKARLKALRDHDISGASHILKEELSPIFAKGGKADAGSI